MTTRHRFLGRAFGDLCGNVLSAGSKCGLPYGSDWHFNDDDHPFTQDHERPQECAWSLQEGVWNGRACSGDPGDNMHTREPGGRVAPGVVTVTMEYPKEESPVVQDPAWGSGHVYPASDDGGEQVEPATERLNVPPNMPALEKEADQYRWTNNEGGPTNTAAPQPEWSRAIDFVRAEGVGLTYGPWPIRKYILVDCPPRIGRVAADCREEMADQLDALDTLEQDYTLVVRRPEGKAWRVAWLTWGWANGYAPEAACDELAAMYG